MNAAAVALYPRYSVPASTTNPAVSTTRRLFQVLCWRKGQGSRVHNHARSHGFVTVLQGRVEETRWVLR